MTTPATINLGADRYTPFVDAFRLTGIDLTGADFKMQVRDRKNGGAVRADLTTVASVLSQGVSIAGVDLVAGSPVTDIAIRIDEAAMTAVPTGPSIDSDVICYWDLQATPVGGFQQVYAAGTFTVRAGVTQ